MYTDLEIRRAYYRDRYHTLKEDPEKYAILKFRNAKNSRERRARLGAQPSPLPYRPQPIFKERRDYKGKFDRLDLIAMRDPVIAEGRVHVS